MAMNIINGISHDKNVKEMLYHDKCDKYDYLIAIGCGGIAGIIDVFFVGTPLESRIQPWADGQVDKAVMTFAGFCGWPNKENGIKSAISFLEQKFKINYDQKHSGDIDDLFKMSPKNHHMKSLAHSLDIVGLFFSVLNQFTSTSTFLTDGQLITIQTDTFELQGNNFISKLYCGIVNWFGHIMSDIAGSSGALGRGSGIAIPFFELFQMCDFGKFQVDKNRNTLATVATKVFQEGYDARFGISMALPVGICELSIKLIWSIKHFFYHRCALKECIPTKWHDDLRIMLLMGNGMLCLIDGTDSVIRSGGNCVNLFLRLNIIAWYRMAGLVFQEVCIQFGIDSLLMSELNAYYKINGALAEYLEYLKQIDIGGYTKEIRQYKSLAISLEHVKTEAEFHNILHNEYKLRQILLPYQGKFIDFMADKEAVLTFK